MAEPKKAAENGSGKPRKKSGGHISIHFDPTLVDLEKMAGAWPEQDENTTLPSLHTTVECGEEFDEFLKQNGRRVHRYKAGAQMAAELAIQKGTTKALFFGPVVKGEVFDELIEVLKTRKVPVEIIPL